MNCPSLRAPTCNVRTARTRNKVGRQLSALDASLSGYKLPSLYMFMAAAFVAVWLPVPFLRSRGAASGKNE